MPKEKREEIDLRKTKVSLTFLNGERKEFEISSVVFTTGCIFTTFGMSEELYKSKVFDMHTNRSDCRKKSCLRDIITKIMRMSSEGGSLTIINPDEDSEVKTETIPVSALSKITLLVE